MKISEIFQKEPDENSLTSMQRDVLEFFKRHRGEVFPYGDPEIYEELKHLKPAAIDWSLWALNDNGFLAKYKVKSATKVRRKTFFGFSEDIKKLEAEDNKLKKT